MHRQYKRDGPKKKSKINLSINSKKSVEVDELAAAPTCINIIRTRNSSSPLRAHFLQKCVHSFLPNTPHQIIGTNPGHFSDNFA